MADNVAPQVRSRMMSAIKSKNTKLELMIRKALHARGFRYRLYTSSIHGRPDIALPRYHAAIFVNGCFWHGHECHLFHMPNTRREFWTKKLSRNKQRDAQVAAQLQYDGWRQLTIWECSVRGSRSIGLDATIEQTCSWIKGGKGSKEIRGQF